MNRKQKIIVSVTGIFLVLLILVGITYAYFLTQIQGNENNKSISVTTANLRLVYGDGNGVINATNIEPGYTLDEKTFTVKNEGNAETDYAVVIEDVKVTNVSTGATTTFESNDFVYTLSCTSDGEACNGVDTEATFPIEGGIVVGNTIEVGKTHTYSLIVTYKDTGLDQSADMNKTLEAKVNIKDISTINPYNDNTNSLAYNIINNAIALTNKEKDAGYAELVLSPLTKPAAEPTIRYNASGEEATSESSVSISTTYQKYYWTYGTGYTINPVTGKFTLTGVSTCLYNDGSCHETLVGKYIVSNFAFNNSSSTNTQKNTTDVISIYKVTTAPASSTSKITMNAKKINTTYYSVESTLSLTRDDYGTSYYYRGTVKNNYLTFNNMCWRIVRIEGDGSIKIVLADKDAGCSAATLAKTGSAYIGQAAYNLSGTNNLNGTENYEAGEMKTAFNAFLNGGSFLSKNFDTYEYDTITYTAWSADVKSKLKTTTVCIGETTTKYDDNGNILTDSAADELGYWNYDNYKRLAIDKVASLVCNVNGGRTSETQIYPLTADEVVFAGGKEGVANYTYYLRENATSNNWWTLSLSDYNRGGDGIDILGVSNEGQVLHNYVYNDNFSLRPAVSLVSGTKIASGDGSISNPYTIQ